MAFYIQIVEKLNYLLTIFHGAYQIFPKSWIFGIFTYSVCVFAYSHSSCRISFLQIQPRYINSVLTLYFRHCTMWPRLSFALRLFFRGCWGRRGRPASRPRRGHDFPNTFFQIFHSSIVFSGEAIFRPQLGDGLKKKGLYAIEALYQLVVRHKKRYYCLLWVLCYGAALPNSARGLGLHSQLCERPSALLAAL